MQRVFGDYPWALRYYSTPDHVNQLFTWFPFDNPWPLEAFVLQYGIGTGAAARPHQLQQVAALLGRSFGGIQNVRIHERLREASAYLRLAPSRSRNNEFLALGLPATIWVPLVNKRIRTVETLCTRSLTDLRRIEGLSEPACLRIQDSLMAVGKTLRRLP